MNQLVAYKKKIESRTAGILKGLKITLTKRPQWVKWSGTGKLAYLILFPYDANLDNLNKAAAAMKRAFRAAEVASTECSVNMNRPYHPPFITITLKHDYESHPKAHKYENQRNSG